MTKPSGHIGRIVKGFLASTINDAFLLSFHYDVRYPFKGALK